MRGSGVAKTESRPVSNFNAVVLSTSGSLVIEQTGVESLTITADDNILPLLRSEVIGGQLRLDTQPGSSFSSITNIRYTLTVKDLKAVTVNGSGGVVITAIKGDTFEANAQGSGGMKIGSVNAKDQTYRVNGSGSINVSPIKAEALTLISSSSGNINASEIDSSTLKVSLSGSGNALAAGKTDVQNAVIAGSGNYHGEKLISRESSVNLSASGTAQINVTGKLDANVTGSGSLFYTGSPETVNTKRSGSGSIQKR